MNETPRKVWRHKDITACFVAEELRLAGVKSVTPQALATALDKVGLHGATSQSVYMDKLRAMGLINYAGILQPIPMTTIHVAIPAMFAVHLQARITEHVGKYAALTAVWNEDESIGDSL